MKRLYPLLISVCLFADARGQQLADSVLALKLSQDAWAIRSRNLDSAFHYAFKGLAISREIGHKRSMMVNALALSECFRQAGRFDRAIDYTRYAETLAHEMRPNDYNFFSVGNSYGMLYWTIGEYERALNSFNKARAPVLRWGDPDHIATLYNNIGVAFLFKGTLDSADVYFEKALELNTSEGNEGSIAYNHFNLGKVEFGRGNFEKGLMLFEKSRAESSRLGNKPLEASALKEMSKVYLAQGKNRLALQKAEAAIAAATAPKAFFESQNAYEMAYKSSVAVGELEKAIDYLQRYASLKDSINQFHQDLVRDAYEIERRLEQKETEVQRLKQQAGQAKFDIAIRDQQLRVQWFAILCAVLLAVMMVVIMVAQRRRHKMKRRYIKELENKNLEIAGKKDIIEKVNLQLELSLCRSKVDPHFIFNVLNSVANLVLEKRPEEASDFLARFAKLIRYVLQKSSDVEATLGEEVEMLKAYISLERLRLGNNFDFNITTNAPSDALIPVMLLQPYVENAILHGLSTPAVQGLYLHIFIEAQKENTLEIRIINNGNRRSVKSRLNGHFPHGMSLGKERLELMSRLFSERGYGIECEELNPRIQDPLVEKFRVTVRVPLKGVKSDKQLVQTPEIQ